MDIDQNNQINTLQILPFPNSYREFLHRIQNYDRLKPPNSRLFKKGTRDGYLKAKMGYLESLRNILFFKSEDSFQRITQLYNGYTQKTHMAKIKKLYIVLRKIGTCCFHLAEYDEGIKYLESAMTVEMKDEEFYLSYNTLAKIYLKKRKFDRALRYINVAIQNKPTNQTLQNTRREITEELENYNNMNNSVGDQSNVMGEEEIEMQRRSEESFFDDVQPGTFDSRLIRKERESSNSRRVFQDIGGVNTSRSILQYPVTSRATAEVRRKIDFAIPSSGRVRNTEQSTLNQRKNVFGEPDEYFVDFPEDNIMKIVDKGIRYYIKFKYKEEDIQLVIPRSRKLYHVAKKMKEIINDLMLMFASKKHVAPLCVLLSDYINLKKLKCIINGIEYRIKVEN